MIYISSDHRGVGLKNYLVEELPSKGIEVVDLGPNIVDDTDDYPDFAKQVAERVQTNHQDKGILICANGVGMSIAANKFKGIRAAISWNSKHAQSARNDDDSNILVLPADYVSKEEAVDIIKTWLSTPFTALDRYVRRINKITQIEEK